MRLVYIANIRLPTEKAHGIQIMKMCEAFADNGLEVELLVPRRWNDLYKEPFDFYKVKKVFKLTWIPCLDLVNFDVARIGFIISTFTFLIFTRIYLFFRPYDILYTREQFTGLFFRHFIFELHALPGKISRSFRYLINRADRLVVLTSFTKEKLLKLGLADDKIFVSPDAVDIKEFDIDISKEEARKKMDLPLDKKIILYTGSFLLYGWKGSELLPEAAALLSDDYLFVLVGGHPWELEKMKKTLNLRNTLLVPYKPHDLMPYYLKAADILVLPNRRGSDNSELYTSPLKLFEYMASKRPIIASDLPSLKEVLTEKEALFFVPGSAEDLAKTISRLISDEKLKERLSQRAYFKVSGYTWDKRADKIIKWILP